MRILNKIIEFLEVILFSFLVIIILLFLIILGALYYFAIYVKILLKRIAKKPSGIIFVFIITLLSIFYATFSDIIQSNGFTLYSIVQKTNEHKKKIHYSIKNLELDSSINYYFLFMLDESGSTNNAEFVKKIVKTQEKLLINDVKNDNKVSNVVKTLLDTFNRRLDTILVKNYKAARINTSNNFNLNKEIKENFIKLKIRKKILANSLLSIRNVKNKYFAIALWNNGNLLSDQFPLINKKFWLNPELNKDSILINAFEKICTNDGFHEKTDISLFLSKIINNIDSVTKKDSKNILVLTFISDFYDEENPFLEPIELRLDSIKNQFLEYQVNLLSLPTENITQSKKVTSTFKRYTNYEEYQEIDWFNDIVKKTYEENIILPDYINSIVLPKIKTQKSERRILSLNFCKDCEPNDKIIFPYSGRKFEKDTLHIDIDSIVNKKSFLIALKRNNIDNLDIFAKIVDKNIKHGKNMQINQYYRFDSLNNGKLEIIFTNKNSAEPPENLWLEIIPNNKPYKYFSPIIFQRSVPEDFYLYYQGLIIFLYLNLIYFFLGIKNDADWKKTNLFLNHKKSKLHFVITAILIPVIILFWLIPNILGICESSELLILYFIGGSIWLFSKKVLV